MAGKVCNQWFVDAFKDLLAGGVPPSLKLRLYSNNYTPQIGDAVGAYTECAIAGYAAVALATANWVIGAAPAPIKATYPQQAFTFTAAGSVYGYYVTDAAGTVVYWAEIAAGAPFTYSAGGGSLLVTLELDAPSV